MKSAKHVSRRQFISRTALAGTAFTIVPRHVLGGPKFVPPSEKVNVALVGVGGQGRSNMRALFQLSDAQIIAVADPIENHDLADFYYKGNAGRKPVKAEVEKHYSKTTPNHTVAEYEDFRVMLEKEKDIDAILCATPDHSHAFISIAAMRAGKHVYCEKPLTHNIWEARQVAKVARETGVATQMGNQLHSNEGIRETCEWIWNGAIGAVREVHAWVETRRWNPTLTGRPKETPPIPPGVNWDLWLGPRESRPFHPAYTPVAWRDFWAFGSGALGDFGCHDLDAAVWALDLHEPTSVEAKPVGKMDADITPHGEICYFNFPARGNKPPVKVTWYDGGLMPPRPEELGPDEALPNRGVLFVGDKGLVLCAGAGGKPRLLPASKMDAYKIPAPTLPRSKGHHRDWVDAIKGGAPASSNFEYGARLTEIALLGVLSLRTGRKIYWDAAKMEAKHLPKADEIIKEQYRKGWEII
jgi:predicted dehydrogenase